MKLILPTLAAVAAFLTACSQQDADGGAALVSNETGPSGAVAGATDTPAQIIARLFQSADLNQSGRLTRPEAIAYMGSILISKDSDDDGSLTLTEFQEWDAGFLAIAEQGGIAANYNARKEDIFKRWDANGDGLLTLEEFHGRVGEEFAAAPRAQEGRMTVAEFGNVAFVKDMAAAAVG